MPGIVAAVPLHGLRPVGVKAGVGLGEGVAAGAGVPFEVGAESRSP